MYVFVRYFENKVFVALGGGELCIYKRDVASGTWDLTAPETIHVSITGAAISCMTAVAGRIWCGCQNTIVLVNATSLRLEVAILLYYLFCFCFVFRKLIDALTLFFAFLLIITVAPL